MAGICLFCNIVLYYIFKLYATDISPQFLLHLHEYPLSAGHFFSMGGTMANKIPENVISILRTLESRGYEAYTVGGAVRDTLLGREPGDWDVTTSATPQEVMSLFSPHAIPTGLQHGTVTVGGGRGVEVTTFREDGDYTDHRRPDSVTFCRSLREDLARRDFTVNAIAMDVRGHIEDPFDGQGDLAAGILRAVGRPEKRFQEDALRIMRGLRFASRLGFSIEPHTAAAMNACAPLLREIAPERLLVEMTGLLMGDAAGKILREYPSILGEFLPEILPAVGLDQKNPYHIYTVWDHTAHAVDAAPKDPILRWTMLLHDLGKPETFTVDEDDHGHFYGHHRASARIAGEITSRLRFDKRSRGEILTLVDRHDAQLEPTSVVVRRNLAKYGEDTLRRLLDVKRADTMAQAPRCFCRLEDLDRWEALLDETLAADACFSLKDLAVKGGDLVALGFHGPKIGQLLQTLLELVMEDTLPNDRETLLTYTKENLQ